MSEAVLFSSFNTEAPHGHGVQELRKAAVVKLSPDNIFSAFRFFWNQNTGTFSTGKIFSCEAEDYFRPNRLGGFAEDGRNQKLVVTMQQVGQKGEQGKFKMPLFLADTEEFQMDLNDPEVQRRILWSIGPEGMAQPSALAPEGVIEEIVQDRLETIIGFQAGQVVTLPSTARLAPWVRPGVETQAGAVLGDLVPRITYSWIDFLNFSPEVIQRVVFDVKSVKDYGSLTDIRVVPRDKRMSLKNGGVVKHVFVYLPPNRWPVLTDTVIRHSIGNFVFGVAP